MSKKYELLKDLPDSKAGDVYIWMDDLPFSFAAYYKDGDVSKSWWFQSSVEDNPSWFREIKDKEESSKPFWDDEKVSNYAWKLHKKYLEGKSFSSASFMEEFKETVNLKLNDSHRMPDSWMGSPSPFPPNEKKRVEAFVSNEFHSLYHHHNLYSSIPIPDEKYPAIRQAIEQILNSAK